MKIIIEDENYEEVERFAGVVRVEVDQGRMLVIHFMDYTKKSYQLKPNQRMEIEQ